MSRRNQIVMKPEEVRHFLAGKKTIVITSNGPGGFPHAMPMWFVLDDDGSVRMTTYNKSQKVVNIRRDPRVSLLAESGEEYTELRGVVLYGHAEVLEDRELILDTLMRASGADPAAMEAEELERWRAGMMKTAEKRALIRCKPDRIVSWDHSKLGGVY